MTLPHFRSLTGEISDLEWTRIQPDRGIAEALPTVRSAMGWGSIPGVATICVGEETRRPTGGLSRRVLERFEITEDAGTRRAGTVVYQVPSLTGRTVLAERDPAWQVGHLPRAADHAREILRGHGFPADFKWPQPNAWVWDAGDLYWAIAPRDDGLLIFADGSSEPLSVSQLDRGGLGYLDRGDPDLERPSPKNAKLGELERFTG